MSHEVTVAARDVHRSYRVKRDGTEIGIGKTIETVDALKGISLLAHRGESIGVLGRNGAGKSTLFRLLAGADSATSGTILTSSKPKLLSVNAALQSGATGRENIKLGLLAMGLKPADVSKRVDDIAKWADVENAVDRPLSTYSSGMRSRLVFGISTSVQREILLIDEALSTGDRAFQERAKQRMRELVESSGTVFLVSHGRGTVTELCNRAIWLHDGEIVSDGPADEVTRLYVRWSKRTSQADDEGAQSLLAQAKREYKPPRIMLLSEMGGLSASTPTVR